MRKSTSVRAEHECERRTERSERDREGLRGVRARGIGQERLRGITRKRVVSKRENPVNKSQNE